MIHKVKAVNGNLLIDLELIQLIFPPYMVNSNFTDETEVKIILDGCDDITILFPTKEEAISEVENIYAILQTL